MRRRWRSCSGMLEQQLHSGIGSEWQLHGRYSHARAYVERALIVAGLQPWITPAELRMESGAPVAGLVIRGMKPAAALP
jgi:predicted TPR repeat methyltransferase